MIKTSTQTKIYRGQAFLHSGKLVLHSKSPFLKNPSFLTSDFKNLKVLALVWTRGSQFSQGELFQVVDLKLEGPRIKIIVVIF
jgi:hypothetical protein